MIKYYVVSKRDEEGSCKIHTSTCSNRPHYPNFKEIGYCRTVAEALKKAGEINGTASLCESCCIDDEPKGGLTPAK